MNNFLKLCEEHKLWVKSAGKNGVQLSLDGMDMRDIKLAEPLFEQAFFSECNFSGMSFEDADIYQSEFYSCNFTNVQFSNCDFRKSTLDFSDFSGAAFVGCKFPRVDSFKTDFSRCIFKDCSFVGFSIMEGILNGVQCKSVDFDEVYFDKVIIENFTLAGSKNLDRANHISFYLSENSALIEGLAAIKWLAEHNS